MIIIKDDRSTYFSVKVLFPSAEEYLPEFECDIVKYLRSKLPIEKFKKSLCYTYNTLFSDLSVSDENILSEYSRTTKQQIKKAINENSIDIEFFTHADLEGDSSIIADLRNTFMTYCEKVNNPALKNDYVDRNVTQYIDNKCIMVSRARFNNGKVYHLYVWGQEDSLFEYSASDYINEDITGILAGMANKLLIYRDMLWLKERGVKNYDWGGITSFEEPNGIDRFKMLFGGKPSQVYSYFVGNTMKGKAFVNLKKIDELIK